MRKIRAAESVFCHVKIGIEWDRLCFILLGNNIKILVFYLKKKFVKMGINDLDSSSSKLDLHLFQEIFEKAEPGVVIDSLEV